MMEGSSNSMTAPNVRRRGLNRREILAAGVAGAAITGFPYVSRAFAAQTLKFWQFYGPGGGLLRRTIGSSIWPRAGTTATR
jgi:hypothetical protein